MRAWLCTWLNRSLDYVEPAHARHSLKASFRLCSRSIAALSEVIADLTESRAQYHLRKLQKDAALMRVGLDRGGHLEVLVDVLA